MPFRASTLCIQQVVKNGRFGYECRERFAIGCMNAPSHRLLNLPHPRLRTPRNRSACLWHLLDLVSRGHHRYTRGLIRNPRKVPDFVEKMHARFGVLLSPSGRAKRRARGMPTAHLVMYRDWDDVWLWWLLVGGADSDIDKLANRFNETLHRVTCRNTRLMFRDEYVLRQRQRPRKQGGGRVWTWYLSRALATQIERELVKLASGHGHGRERVDDLVHAVERLRNRPMFSGVRTQARAALYRARRIWAKTHDAESAYPQILDEVPPWFGNRPHIFG